MYENLFLCPLPEIKRKSRFSLFTYTNTHTFLCAFLYRKVISKIYNKKYIKEMKKVVKNIFHILSLLYIYYCINVVTFFIRN